ncbi:sensor histidine kinase [Extibacter muris]|uniref:sensor histidine kinase n=1 Tax=Extibacter muris TaxID=1796622 RepID=UPI001D085292|nr:sensor histidine kinase [Extibacter muris]MCB6203325.1 sensor histidine kinase [Extibacter muris]MCQ4664673.1 sensor histidine kinase [Extibacter muris]MCQ4693844.1 sensor histidine kinase [Extibacter muris]
MKNKKAMINRIANLQLGTKIVGIILIVILLMISSSIAGITMVLNSSNKLLYQALAGSLTYSAEDISRKISNIESMTSAIVSNSNIRKNLITLNDEESGIRTGNAENALETLLADYYSTYKNNSISYINLYYPGGVVQSYEAQSSSVPEQVHKEVIAAANNVSGYPCAVTEYCNSYGLFLGRDSRRVEQMNFHRLGTVVVCVDMNRLIRSSTRSVLPSEETQYALLENGSEFYHSDGISSEQLKDINRQLRSDYGVVTVDSDRYFAVQGTIKNTSWDYICLIPYDRIFQTLSFTMLLALAIILVSVLIAILLSRMLIRSVTEDFRRLVNKMKAFGKDESKAPDIGYDYSSRIDEIGVLHNQFDQMTIKIQDLIQQNYVNEILSKDARLKALENQINPHFLYNTLEAVNWRAKAIGEKDISSMVEALGTLLRETLSSGTRNFTLSHELEIVQCYLTIQRIRFEDRLTYSQEVEPGILDISLPHFTIQPLVENSVNYAMEKNTEVCHIRLEGARLDDTITIDVINNGSQFEANLLEKLENGLITPHGFGIGLLNIHKRIQLTYGTGYGLILFNRDEEHAVARIIIPGGTHAESIDSR